ncbi:MAG: hypothetical protein AABX70_04055 [Nanoarchaeota archaeon]
MRWNQQELVCLKENFPITEDKKLSDTLGKSPNALRIKASRLGIKKASSLIREELELNEVEEQVVIGSLLGDLSCRINHTSKNANLEGGHCLAQKEYMLWKIALLQRLNFKIRKTKIGTYLFQSKNFRALNEYHDLFYSNGKKSVNRLILDRINKLGLLIWYLDDGSYHKRDNQGKLHTNGFSFEEQVLIKEWFKEKYGIDPRIHTLKGSKKYEGKVWYYLSFTVDDTKRLLSLFKEFEVPSCMKYKLGDQTTSHSILLNEVTEQSSWPISG